MSENNYIKMLDDASLNENVESKGKQRTIYPYQVIYLCWKQLISISAILILVEIPFELFFGPEYYDLFESEIFTIYRSFIAVLLFGDILLSFNVQYLDEGRLIKSRQEIAEHYISELFIFDIVPLGIVILTTFYIVPIWVQLFFLLKIKSIGYTDMVTQEQLIYHKNWLIAYKYLRIIVIMCYTFHFYGCVFYGIGFYSEEIDQPTWIDFSNSDLGIIMDYEWLSRYIIATYFAVETLVTTGYGQITPLNGSQIIVANFVQVSSMFLVLFVVSSINMLQDNDDRNQQLFFAIQKFMKAYKISRSTKQEIIIYLKFYIDQVKKRDLEMESIVEARLPKDLRKQLLFQAFRTKLQQIVWLVNLVSEECLMELCTVVREIFYIAQFDIFQNESEINLYLVLTGDVELKLNKSQISIIPIGQSFGEYSFITDQPRTCQAFTFTYSQLLVLPQYEFLRVLRKYPKDYQKYSLLREQVQINHRFSFIGLSCFLCQKQSHLCSECPLINLKNKFKKHSLTRYIEMKKLLQMQILESEMLEDLVQNRESYYSERKPFIRFSRRLPFVKMIISEFQMKKYEILENCCLDIDKPIFMEKIELETHNSYHKSTIKFADVIQDLSSPFDMYETNTKVIKFLDYFFPIIEPRNKWFRRWKYLIQFISVWLFIGVPMMIFYEQDYYYIGRNPVLYIIRLIVAVILFSDICLEFRVDYYKKDKIVSSRKAIVKNYLSSYFIFDFIPIVVIIYFTVSDNYILLHLLILLRLIPFYRIEQNLMQKLRLKPSYEMVYLMLRMFIEVIYLNHFFGCLFYGAGAYVYIQYPEMKTWVNDSSCNFGVVMEYSYFKKYILATYWAMNALTTVGYGDIVPLNVVEMIITNFASICAIMLVAINISNILTMKCQLNQSQFAEENYCIQQFMIQKGCSKQLRKDVENYLRNYFMFYNNRDIHLEQQSFQMLPVFLKQNLLYEAYSKIFSNHWFSHQFDHEIHLLLTQSMLEGYYSPMDILFQDKTFDFQCSIYFIQGGCVEIFLNPKDPKCLVYLKKGAVFGDYSFVTGMTRLASARTIKYSQLISLQRKDFMKIMYDHPKQYKKFIHMKNRILFNKEFSLLDIQCYTCNSTDHTSISCPLTQYDPNTNTIIVEKNRISMMTQKEQDRNYCQRSKNRKKTLLFTVEMKSLQFISESNLRGQNGQSFFLEKSEINYDIDVFKE